MEGEQYDNIIQWDGKDNAEIQETLQPHKVQLAKRLELGNITGKQGRTVPLVLTSDVKTAIATMLKLIMCCCRRCC